MQLVNNSPGPKYSFENDLSGRLFCWLIESGQVDYQGMIEQTAESDADPQPWVKRFAAALEAKVGADWRPAPPAASKPADAAPATKAPAYNIWFRPSPSKKIKFKEVANALLVYTGRISPPAESP